MAADLGAPDGIIYNLWPDDRDMPTHSMPALEAGKAAEFQGHDAFLTYHEALLRAFFELNRDISDRQVLLEVAEESGLDMKRFRRDLKSKALHAAVLADLEEAQGKRIDGIPTAIFADVAGAIRVVGEVKLDQYKRVVDWLLAT